MKEATEVKKKARHGTALTAVRVAGTVAVRELWKVVT